MTVRKQIDTKWLLKMQLIQKRMKKNSKKNKKKKMKNKKKKMKNKKKKKSLIIIYSMLIKKNQQIAKKPHNSK